MDPLLQPKPHIASYTRDSNPGAMVIATSTFDVYLAKWISGGTYIYIRHMRKGIKYSFYIYILYFENQYNRSDTSTSCILKIEPWVKAESMWWWYMSILYKYICVVMSYTNNLTTIIYHLQTLVLLPTVKTLLVYIYICFFFYSYHSKRIVADQLLHSTIGYYPCEPLLHST